MNSSPQRGARPAAQRSGGGTPAKPRKPVVFLEMRGDSRDDRLLGLIRNRFPEQSFELQNGMPRSQWAGDTEPLAEHERAIGAIYGLVKTYQATEAAPELPTEDLVERAHREYQGHADLFHSAFEELHKRMPEADVEHHLSLVDWAARARPRSRPIVFGDMRVAGSDDRLFRIVQQTLAAIDTPWLGGMEQRDGKLPSQRADPPGAMLTDAETAVAAVYGMLRSSVGSEGDVGPGEEQLVLRVHKYFDHYQEFAAGFNERLRELIAAVDPNEYERIIDTGTWVRGPVQEELEHPVSQPDVPAERAESLHASPHADWPFSEDVVPGPIVLEGVAAAGNELFNMATTTLGAIAGVLATVDLQDHKLPSQRSSPPAAALTEAETAVLVVYGLLELARARRAGWLEHIGPGRGVSLALAEYTAHAAQYRTSIGIAARTQYFAAREERRLDVDHVVREVLDELAVDWPVPRPIVIDELVAAQPVDTLFTEVQSALASVVGPSYRDVVPVAGKLPSQRHDPPQDSLTQQEAMLIAVYGLVKYAVRSGIRMPPTTAIAAYTKHRTDFDAALPRIIAIRAASERHLSALDWVSAAVEEDTRKRAPRAAASPTGLGTPKQRGKRTERELAHR